MNQPSHAELAHVVRDHAGRLAASLVHLVGDFAAAEDLVADAVEAALTPLADRRHPGPARRLALHRCPPRNVTGLVDALEDAGFVARTRHPTDRRAVLVALTARGEALSAGWGVDRDDGIARLFAGTSSTDLAIFATVLDGVLAALRTTSPNTRTPDTAGNPVANRPAAGASIKIGQSHGRPLRGGASG